MPKPVDHDAPERLPATLRTRAARDEDALGLIRLIGSIFSEYAHCYLDVDREARELRAIHSAFRAQGGTFWVCELPPGEIVASVGWVPTPEGHGLELRKLYVARPLRRFGLASALCARVEADARRLRARRVELWSDTKFTTAHRFYEARGYRHDGRTRALHDRSDTVELHFERALDEASGGGE